MKNKWTEEMLILSIDLVKSGKTYKEISETINKSIKSIQCKLFRIDVKTSDYVEYKKDIIKRCLNCEKEIIGFNKNFCSKSCAAIYNNPKKRKIKYCLLCDKELNLNSIKFCNHTCQQIYYKNIFLEKWKNQELDGSIGKIGDISRYIKEYMFKKYDSRCAKCGWNEKNEKSGKIPLQIDHIDGDYKNNKENNLILLCPNCHSLTPTFGGLNYGNGRKYRRERYKNENGLVV